MFKNEENQNLIKSKYDDPTMADSDSELISEKINIPKCKITVEPIMIFIMAALVFQLEVSGQYLYYAVGKHYNLTTKNETLGHHCVPPALNFNNSAAESNDKKITNQIQSLTTMWSTYISAAGNTISLIATPIYGVYSDKLGRKLPLITVGLGFFISSFMNLVIMFFDWPLYYLVIISGSAAVFGGTGTFWACMFAYIADITTKEERTLRIIILDFSSSVCLVIIEIITGYWITAYGFNQPYLASVILSLLSLLYTIFFVKETRKRSENIFSVNVAERLKQSVLVFVKSGRDKVCLLFSLAAFACFTLISNTSSVTMLYELNWPFCWNSTMIGIYSAIAMTFIFIGMMGGYLVLKRCGVSSPIIIIIGFTSAAISKTLYGIATSNWVLYLSVPFSLFTFLPSPVLRSYMSQHIHPDEQGALFGGMAFVQVLFTFAATWMFNSIYMATLRWYSGFVFITTAGVACVGIVCILFVICSEYKQKKHLAEIEDKKQKFITNNDSVDEE